MIHVYTDGASAGNPGPSGAGLVFLKDGEAQEFRFHLGDKTNHEAEFAAVDIALEICLQKEGQQVAVRTDSKLVSDSIEKGHVKTKAYAGYLCSILDKIAQLELFFIMWVPSKQNKKADELARLAIREPKRLFR
ncbi:ribonuclease HI [Shouchella clausii]|uniref:RNase H family protein n=1 Tax=Shouchella clausii TaxID=79880 RepID=UPI000B974F12|nr:RNase H family protein [Shouchella clausii]AST97757.1 ribonuclease HI [Shouchella clausii]MBU8595101.1 reverse transcriptase-like protein [Shouchella clausii]MCY1104558.1 reverse transcriptase-like protein [Shouchella clausii]MEB5474999.1 reverse transcriptase-like protein [Shouchella clausii]MED4157988.1 reverse transcriptase-like protein [Shouchella clausii]